VKSKIRGFLDQFNFREKMKWHIGIERERFIVNHDGLVVPKAKEFLEAINDPLWTNELSACQVEDRTAPNDDIGRVFMALKRNDEGGQKIAKKTRLALAKMEVGPPDMPTKIFPSDRYRQIKQSVSPEQLLAACRVAGTHVHIGMANLKECITAYNILRKYLDYFCKLGDHSNGERLRLYKTMAKNWVPPEIKDAENFFEIAEKNSFVEDPRNCHWLIRISAHGTVELRMFGSYNYLSEVTDYAGMAVLALLDNGFNR